MKSIYRKHNKALKLNQSNIFDGMTIDEVIVESIRTIDSMNITVVADMREGVSNNPEFIFNFNPLAGVGCQLIAPYRPDYGDSVISGGVVYMPMALGKFCRYQTVDSDYSKGNPNYNLVIHDYENGKEFFFPSGWSSRASVINHKFGKCYTETNSIVGEAIDIRLALVATCLKYDGEVLLAVSLDGTDLDFEIMPHDGSVELSNYVDHIVLDTNDGDANDIGISFYNSFLDSFEVDGDYSRVAAYDYVDGVENNIDNKLDMPVWPEGDNLLLNDRLVYERHLRKMYAACLIHYREDAKLSAHFGHFGNITIDDINSYAIACTEGKLKWGREEMLDLKDKAALSIKANELYEFAKTDVAEQGNEYYSACGLEDSMFEERDSARQEADGIVLMIQSLDSDDMFGVKRNVVVDDSRFDDIPF